MRGRSVAGPNGPPAVVIGLDCITGLQTARILANRGAQVVGIASDRNHFACRTRACRRVVEVETGHRRLVAALEELAQELGDSPVVFPCTDLSVLCVSEHRDRLSCCLKALPPADVVETLVDKVKFSAFAATHGFQVPRTFLLHDVADVDVAVSQIAFPCVVKPAVKTPRWMRHTKAKAYIVDDADGLVRLYDRCSGWADVLMAQEWIDGPESELYSFNGYFDESSQPLATFIARKVRQWPPETGTSSLGEECRNDIVLREALRLFQLAGHRGLAYLEMKRDPRTDKHYIIEPNVGRPTGRSSIAEAGGVELLWTMYSHLAGKPLPVHRTQQYGHAKWIYWRQDLRAGFHQWRRGRLSLVDWLRSVQGKKQCAVFSWSDPLPFVSDWTRIAAKQLHPPTVPARWRERVAVD